MHTHADTKESHTSHTHTHTRRTHTHHLHKHKPDTSTIRTPNTHTHANNRKINEDLGVPFFADHIRALSEIFDSKLADAGTP